MTCFIANPSVCRSYAKTHGWQETLAHFFVKYRRSISKSSSQQFSSSNVSNNVLETSAKDPPMDLEKENSNDKVISTTASLESSSVRLPEFETTSSIDDSKKEQTVQLLDLSSITDENTYTNRNRTPSLSIDLLTPNSLKKRNFSIDSRDITPEFLQRNSEDFQQNATGNLAKRLQSTSDSREDLLLTDDVMSNNSSNDALSPLPRTITSTSIKHLYIDEENNEQAERLGPEVRQILGSLIGTYKVEMLEKSHPRCFAAHKIVYLIHLLFLEGRVPESLKLKLNLSEVLLNYLIFSLSSHL